MVRCGVNFKRLQSVYRCLRQQTPTSSEEFLVLLDSRKDLSADGGFMPASSGSSSMGSTVAKHKLIARMTHQEFVYGAIQSMLTSNSPVFRAGQSSASKFGSMITSEGHTLVVTAFALSLCRQETMISTFTSGDQSEHSLKI